MARNGQNEAFLRTSFLSAANAPYIEDMQAEYERNPGAVSDEWRRFFESIKEAPAQPGAFSDAPAWARRSPRFSMRPAPIAISSAPSDRRLRRFQSHHPRQDRAPRPDLRFELTPAASLRATQDSIRALMLIRAYRVIGHLAADLDPLGLADRRVHRELMPETYGFTEGDLDRPIFIDRVMGHETATMRQILGILRRTYCRKIGVQFTHITDPTQKGWIQERIEGAEKDIRFTTKGQKAILRKLIETETFEKFCDLKYTGTKRFGLDGAESIIRRSSRSSSAVAISCS